MRPYRSKCTHNLLLLSEKLYIRDKHGMIHMLYKLTDTHLSSVTQCAMKLSVAAQAIRHTVAAGIYSLVSAGKELCLHSFVVRNNVTYSNVTGFLVGKLFFKLANCDNETSVELLQFLCFLWGCTAASNCLQLCLPRTLTNCSIASNV